MKLYDMTRAPNPRRVRIFLAEKGVEIEKVEVDLGKGEHLTPAFLAKCPRGLVPALELDDGTVIDESVAICRYIEETHPDHPLFGATPVEKAQVEQWQRIVEFDGLANVGHAFRNSVSFFANHAVAGAGIETAQIPALAERGFALMPQFFERMNERLGETAYLAGENFSIADITLLCVIDFARWVKIVPDPKLEHLAHWHQAVSARPSATA